MAPGKEGSDFYAVLGLKKDCSPADLRNAYKKLALRWHPDRCSNSANTKHVEESKKKFQSIQEAYSVLSDANKRFLYDMGVYDSDDEDGEGMCSFLDEMATMMSQVPSSTADAPESFEALRDLFDEMFPDNMTDFCSTSKSSANSLSNDGNSSCKQNNTKRNYIDTNLFTVGEGNAVPSNRESKMKRGKKPKVSARPPATTHDAEISV